MVGNFQGANNCFDIYHTGTKTISTFLSNNKKLLEIND